jgi:hypothetical protein
VSEVFFWIGEGDRKERRKGMESLVYIVRTAIEFITKIKILSISSVKSRIKGEKSPQQNKEQMLPKFLVHIAANSFQLLGMHSKGGRILLHPVQRLLRWQSHKTDFFVADAGDE